MGNSNGKPVVFTDEGKLLLSISGIGADSLYRFTPNCFHMVSLIRAK